MDGKGLSMRLFTGAFCAKCMAMDAQGEQFARSQQGNDTLGQAS
jgi:hypothetical protein